MTPEQLFKDFCYYRDNTANIRKLKQDHPYMKALKYTKEREDLFRRLMAWCSEKNIPVRQWVYTLFHVRRWMYAPKLEESHLLSEKHVAKFHKVKDYNFYWKYIKEEEQKRNIFDPNVDIVASVEQRKRELIFKGGSKLCMEFMETETFGYQPRSKICKFCNSWYQCSEKLLSIVGFDILQLRNGKKNG